MKLREMFWNLIAVVEVLASEKDPRRFCPRLWRLRKTAIPQQASDVGSPVKYVHSKRALQKCEIKKAVKPFLFKPLVPTIHQI